MPYNTGRVSLRDVQDWAADVLANQFSVQRKEMAVLFASLISSSVTAFLTDVCFLLLKRRDEVRD